MIDFCAVYLTFNSLITPRVGCVLGLRNVPEGVLVQAVGVPPGGGAVALGGNASTQRTVRFADGSIGAFWVFASNEAPISGFELRIYNDLNGSTWASAGTTVDIGEIAAMPAVEVEIERDWIDEPVDPTESVLNRAGQPATVQRQAFRRLDATLAAEGVGKVRAGGLAGGMDWAKLRTVMFGDRRVVAVPRYATPAGLIDAAELNRTALYGIGRMGPTAHVSGDHYKASASFQEVPALT